MKKRKDFTNGHFLINQKAYLLMCIIFLGGICIGAVVVNMLLESSFMASRDPLTQALSNKQINSVNIMWTSFFSNMKLILFIWFTGFTRFSLPCGLVSVGFKGTVVGFSIATFIRLYGAKGILVALFAILPQYIVLIPVIFYMVIFCSTYYASSKSHSLKTKKLPGYLLILMAGVAGVLVSAFIDGFLTSKLLTFIPFV